MKQFLLAIAMLGITYGAAAQTSMKMKDGVMMKNNKAMLCNGKKCTPLTATFTCSDGCKVSPDGTVTKPDGTSMKLMNGYEIDKDGKTMMIAHGQAGHVCTKDCPMAKKM
ncbi:hypothetical protein QWZ08_13605 [Ferruginibacter paludis]|uniref:DUF6799 domain-containing protein n=1 Tax=Ferruginibacter paludis TaxID=1310417 RepID=UPI0025B3A12C|nr:DUF6799 domain-containing protein [Ferruginibacter paludis]MDN3656675.1 hypothetical protein [Ferruginibacter paludis]